MKDLCDSQGHRVQSQLVEDGYGNVGSGVQGLPHLGVRSDGSGSL